MARSRPSKTTSKAQTTAAQQAADRRAPAVEQPQPAQALLPAAPLTAWRVLQLQRHIGNRAVGRQLAQRSPATVQRRPAPGVCPTCGRRGRGTCSGCGQPFVPLEDGVQRAPVVQRKEDTQSRAEAIATDVYDALDWVDDEAKVLRALRRGVDIAYDVRVAFFRKYNESIRNYLEDDLSGDDLVKAYALVGGVPTQSYTTAMGLALIPTGTRDDELFKILETLPLRGRWKLEKEYNQIFGSDLLPYERIGEGSFVSDLRDDLSGDDEDKALLLMDHDLTAADKLYLKSAGIVGTKEESVVKIVQEEWGAGMGRIAKLHEDWDKYIRGTSGWWEDYKPSEPLTDESLYATMDGELSGEEWQFVKAVLKGYKALQEIEAEEKFEALLAEHAPELAGQMAAGRPDPNARATQVMLHTGYLLPSIVYVTADEAKRLRLENVRLDVHFATLNAAASGLGTNEEQTFRAVEEIRKTWEARRARAAEDADLKADYDAAWQRTRQFLLEHLPTEMSTSGDEYKKARLLLAGALTKADEAWLASIEHDNSKVIKLLDAAWAAGEMDALLQDAAHPRVDPADGKKVRPSFETWELIPLTHGLPARRAITISRSDMTDVERGAFRMNLEISEGDSDSNLEKAFTLVMAAKPDVRKAVVARYAQAYMPGGGGDGSAEKQFVDYIYARYEGSHHAILFKDVLIPATTAEERQARIEELERANQKAWYNPVDWGQSVYDTFSAEDTGDILGERLARHKWIASAPEGELAGMLAMTGLENRDQLSLLEYEDFKKHLEKVRQLHKTIADAMALAVELVVDIVITIATGGSGAGLLLASLSSAIAGMLAREAMLGQDYDLFSQENAKQLVLAVATAGFGTAAKPIDEVLDTVKAMEKIGAAGQTFVKAALKEGFTQANVQVLAQAFNDKLPSAEELTGMAFVILAKSVGAGRADQLLKQHGETLRNRIVGNIQQEAIAGLTEEASDLAVKGTGDKTGVEILTGFGSRLGKATFTGTVSAVKTHAAAQVAESREKKKTQALEQEDDEAIAKEKPQSGELIEVEGADATKPGLVAVVVVNDDHHISIIRLKDGVITLIICSDVCTSLRNRIASAEDRGVEGLDGYKQEIDRLEKDLQDPGKRPDAEENLKQLAEDLGEIIRRAGEAKVFGEAADDVPETKATSVDQLIIDGEFVDSKLQTLYDAYVERQSGKKKNVLTPAQWAVFQSQGEPVQRLNQLMAPGWRSQSGGEFKMQGEVDLQVTKQLLSGQAPYPHSDLIGPFPIGVGEHIRLTASEGRGATGETMYRKFLNEGGYDRMPSALRDAFDTAIADGYFRDLGGGRQWPTTPAGMPWEVHHVLPLEWGGHDGVANWVPLPPGDHADLTYWWDDLKAKVRQQHPEAFGEATSAEYVPPL